MQGNIKVLLKARDGLSDLREYVYGDDIRDIEWNVTARHNHPYIKVYQEERELTLIFMIDVSRSTIFGSTAKMKMN